MTERFKNRKSLALKAAIGLVAGVSFLFLFTPQSYGQIRNHVDVFFILAEQGPSVDDGNVFTRTYTKEELSQKAPENPTSDFSVAVQTQVTSLLQSMTQQQNNGKLMEIYNGAAAKNKSDFALYAAAMRDDRIDAGRDGDQLRKYVAGQLQTTASDRALKSNDFLAKVKTGFNFNLDLGDIFSKKAKPQPANVRYGLIIEEIKPDKNAPASAAIGDSVEDQMAYAGRAEVLWTIGPIGEETSKPFSNAAVAESPAEEASYFSRIKAPSGKFNAKLDPASTDTVPSGGSAGVPPVKLTMAQEQGFYELTYQTKNNFEKDKIEHQLKMPIVGELALARRYNETYSVVQTSAYNVLVDRRAPTLNLHYINADSHYAAELRVNKDRHAFGANADLPSGWKASDKLGKNPAEKYKCEYAYSF